MNAREFLGRAYMLEARIDSKTEQLKHLRALTQNTTAVYGREGVSHSRHTDRMADLVARIADMEKQVSESIEKLISIKQEILDAIGRIDECKLQTVLELRYLNMKSWNEISAIMYTGKTNLYRLHKKALTRLQEILDHSEGGNG